MTKITISYYNISKI